MYEHCGISHRYTAAAAQEPSKTHTRNRFCGWPGQSATLFLDHLDSRCRSAIRFKALRITSDKRDRMTSWLESSQCLRLRVIKNIQLTSSLYCITRDGRHVSFTTPFEALAKPMFFNKRSVYVRGYCQYFHVKCVSVQVHPNLDAT